MTFTSRTLLLALAASAYAVWRGPLLLPGCDAYWHLGQIEQLVQQPGWVVRGDLGYLNPSSSIWHGVLASICRATSLEPLQLWILLPALLAPALIFAVARLGRALGGGDGAIPAALFLVLFEGSHLDPWRQLSYPRYVNYIVLLEAIGLAVRYARTGSRAALAAAWVLGGLLAPVHLVEFALFGLLLAFWIVAAALFYRPGAGTLVVRIIAVGLGALAVAAPYLMLVARHSGLLQGVLAPAAPSRLRDTLEVGGMLYILDPRGEFGGMLGAAGLVAIVLSPLLIGSARRDAGSALMLGAVAGPPLLVFNPLLFPLFLRVWPVPEVVHRLALIALVPWAVPTLAAALQERRAPGSRGITRAVAALALVALAGTVGLAAVERARSAMRPGWREELAIAGPLLPAAQHLRSYPARTMLLTDPFTGNVLQAFTGHVPIDVGTIFHGNADLRPRMPSFRLFCDPGQTTAELAADLTELRAQLVVYDGARLADVHVVREHRDRYYRPGSRDVLARNPAVFRPVFAAAGVEVFAVKVPSGPVAEKDAPPEPRRRALLCTPPEGARAAHRQGPVELLLPERATWRARRGASFPLELAVRATRRVPASWAIQLHVIDAAEASSPGLFARLARKVRERFAGGLRRFGAERDLVPDEHQLLELEPGEAVCQAWTVAVPADAVPGTYQVRVELVSKPRPAPVARLLEPAPPGTLAGTLVIE